jgi:hypothetical protein
VLRTTGSSGEAATWEVAPVVAVGVRVAVGIGVGVAVAVAVAVAVGVAVGVPVGVAAEVELESDDAPMALRPTTARNSRPAATRATRAIGFANRESITRVATRDSAPRIRGLTSMASE